MNTLLNRCVAALALFCFVSTQTLAATPHRDTPLSVEQLQVRFPGLELHAVSPVEFEQARRQYAGHSTLVVDALNVQDTAPAITPTSTRQPCPPGTVIRIRRDTNRQLNPESKTEHPEIECIPVPVGSESPAVNVNILGELRSGMGSSHGNGAEVLYVVIGVVVVAVLVIYAVKFAYDIVAQEHQYSRWWDLSFQSSAVLGNNTVDGGTLTALKFAGGIVDDNMRVGLSGELGYMDVDLSDAGANAVHTRATYGMLGPAVRWIIASTPNPSYVFLEVIGGTANDSRIGVLSIARAGFNLGISSHARFGFNLGSMYTDVNDSKGLLDKKTYNSIYGVELGFRF